MLLKKLTDYNASDIYPMHMPGHKRNTALLGGALSYALDITEIPGFDNLMAPTGVLLELSRLAARLYGSGRAFPLVGGSTCGILAAITALAPRATSPRGGTIIMQRGSHISVYNAAGLNGLNTVYLTPRADADSGITGSVAPEDVEAALSKHADASLVVITSPTYEGVISDIAAIAAVSHRRGVPLMVDAAHGAHLGLSPEFPYGAVAAGADIVVMSLHKTLPALTQCALLHISGNLVDADEIARCVNIFGTSSPSYPLLASIDHCLRLIECDGERLFAEYKQRLRRFADRVACLHKLQVLGARPAFYALDPGKIVVSAAGCDLSGPSMAKRMREKHRVEPEMAFADYLVAMTSVMDCDEGFRRLAGAILELDDMAKLTESVRPRPEFTLPKQADTIAGAQKRSGALNETRRCAGMMSLEYVWAYPPGIPLIAPGELLDERVISQIMSLQDAGVTVMSTRGHAPEHVMACAI